MGPRPLEIFAFFHYGDSLYTSESDVYRRQILTYKDGPRTERFKDDSASMRKNDYHNDRLLTALFTRCCVMQ